MSKSKLTRTLLIFLLSSLVYASCSFSQTTPPEEETFTITTYYPAPYGVYKEMRAKRIAIGDNYYNGSQYCWPPDTCANQIDGISSPCWPSSSCNTDLVIEGNVGIGTATPQGSQDSRTIQLDVAENIIAKDIYLDNPNSGSPRWVSEMGIGIISLQTSTLLLNSISNNTTFQDVISLTINIVGSNILVFVDCGWARAGGSYQSILSQRIVRGTDIIDFATLGGAAWSGTMDTLIRGGGNYLFTGLSPGNHTINYQVKTNAFTDKWTINNARMILISW